MLPPAGISGISTQTAHVFSLGLPDRMFSGGLPPQPGMATADADVRHVEVRVDGLRNCGFCPVLTATPRSHADTIHGAALHMLRRHNLDKSVVAFLRIKPIASPGPLTSEAATAIAALACGCGRGRGGHLIRGEAGPNKNPIVSGPMTRGTAVIFPSAAAISSVQADSGANVVVTSTGGTSPTITSHHTEHAGLATTTDAPALVPTNWLWVGDNPPCAKERGRSVPVTTKGPPPIPPVVPIRMLLQLDAVLGHEGLWRALACKLNDRHLPKSCQSVGLQLYGIHVLQLVKGNVLGIIGANIRHGRIDHLVWIEGLPVVPPLGPIAEVVLAKLHDLTFTLPEKSISLDLPRNPRRTQLRSPNASRASSLADRSRSLAIRRVTSTQCSSPMCP